MKSYPPRCSTSQSVGYVKLKTSTSHFSSGVLRLQGIRYSVGPNPDGEDRGVESVGLLEFGVYALKYEFREQGLVAVVAPVDVLYVVQTDVQSIQLECKAVAVEVLDHQLHDHRLVDSCSL
jgi:hypothetical protein